MKRLTARLEVAAPQSDRTHLSIVLRLTNAADRKLEIVNPDMGVPAPAMRWPWSNETYRTSLLISYHFLSMSVTDAAGQRLAERAIATWATPAMRPKLELSPGDSVEIAIPIGEFFDLISGNVYSVAIEYGDSSANAATEAFVIAP